MKAAILYPKLAPYHVARLRAAAAVGAARGDELLVIEAAGAKSDYRWPAGLSAGAGVAHVTLFPGRDYLEIPRREVKRATATALSAAAPDVVVIPGWASALAHGALAWSLRDGVPRVVVSDSQPEDRRQDALRLAAKRLLVGRFQAAFVAGAPHARWMSQLGMPAEDCTLGCDVVDNDAFAPKAPRHPSEGGPIRIVSCLRLLPRKNVLGTLDALARSKVDWHWTIIGYGPQEELIKRRIDELGLADRVRLAGFVPDEEVPARLAEADVYLQPSLVEQWGLAVNEAMAAGLPVIVSDRCGCREDLVRPGVNGYLFDPAGAGSLDAALSAFAQDRPRWSAMGDASRAIVRDWGLPRFAEGLWEACAVAVERGARRRLRDRVLAAALGGS